METVLGIGAIAVLALLVLVVSRSTGASGSETAVLRSELRALSERMAADSNLLASRLEGIDSRMTQTQTSGQDLAQGIFESLGDVRRATASVAEQAKSFTSLQELLGAPKPRGGLGEAMLEELLRQVLPPSAYETQFRFSDGAVVDAIVRAGGQIVCIDSKFPLTNFSRMCGAEAGGERREAERAFARDVHRHITDIASRYIVPDEGTLDFALMYIPAEGVYSEVLRLDHAGRRLFELAIGARVIPMAPLTLYGYLQTLLLGLKCLKIEANAATVLRSCERLHRDIEAFAVDHETLGRHLTNARGKYEDSSRNLGRLRERIERTVELSDGDEPARPALEAVDAIRD